MENMTMRLEGKKLVIEVADVTARLKKSKSGETVIVASTNGVAQTPADGVKLSMTLFTKDGIERF